MAETPAPQPPLIPPGVLVTRFNAGAFPRPFRTALDPLVMAARNLASGWPVTIGTVPPSGRGDGA
jgi:hypothetical protein